MDSIFALRPELRYGFLRSFSRAIGCAYICMWSYLPHPSNCLSSIDGCYLEGETGLPSSSSGSLARRLFDAYRTSLCCVEGQCVPGLAYKEGLPYVELRDSDLMGLASMQVQQQFYKEAGIKTGVFMGCKSGEIELGMTTLSNINMQMSIQQYLQQFVNQPVGLDHQSMSSSSSSSSLRSLSIGSGDSSFLLGNVTTSFMPDALMEATAEQAIRPTASIVPHHQMATMANIRCQDSLFSTPSSNDDQVMARAMLAVIASTPSSPPLLSHPMQQHQVFRGQTMRRSGAFKPYISALAHKAESRKNSISQKMIKRSIANLRRIYRMRLDAGRHEDARPTSNQLHHMISERKRREKLNESFDALRMLLPPGSKKDKTSVLAKTRDYVKDLKAQISELTETNRVLEMQLQTINYEDKDFGDSGERIEVKIISASELSKGVQRICIRIISRVECDMISLIVRILESVKEMKAIISLESVDARTRSSDVNAFAQATLTIQVQVNDWDEVMFKEAVARAADGGTRRP